MRHLFNGNDVIAVFPTGFGKRLNFRAVCHDMWSSKKTKRRNRLLEYHRDFSITKHHLRSSLIGMTAGDLNENLDCLDDIHQGKFHLRIS